MGFGERLGQWPHSPARRAVYPNWQRQEGLSSGPFQTSAFVACYLATILSCNFHAINQSTQVSISPSSTGHSSKFLKLKRGSWGTPTYSWPARTMGDPDSWLTSGVGRLRGLSPSSAGSDYTSRETVSELSRIVGPPAGVRELVHVQKPPTFVLRSREVVL